MLSELTYLARRIAQEHTLMGAARSLNVIRAHATMALAYQHRHSRLITAIATLL